MTWNVLVTEIALLADELDRQGATQRTANGLRQLHQKFVGSWRASRTLKVTEAGIPIPPPRNQSLHPVGCAVEGAFLRFHFEAAKDEGPPTIADYQVEVVGSMSIDGGLIELADHWRVDTHRQMKIDEEAQKNPEAAQKGKIPNASKEPHALFHFQRGGFAQDDFSKKPGFVPSAALPPREDFWRALMQSPGPRVPHLPMCPITAIDYAIGQHDGHTWQRLRSTPEYSNLVKKAHERLWVPFLVSLATPNGRKAWMGRLLATS